jgi:hypothetical protein
VIDLIIVVLLLASIGLATTDRVRARRLGDVVVTTSQGDSLRGYGRRGWRTVYLSSVKLLGDGEQPVSGTFEIPRRHVVMLQRLPERDANAGASDRPPARPGGNVE